MGFSVNAIVSIRNNARLRRERTFLNTKNDAIQGMNEGMVLTHAAKKKLENAAKKRDKGIYLYYLIMLLLAASVVGYIAVFQW